MDPSLPIAPPVQSTLANDIQLVRHVLMRELETISAYEAYSAQSTNPTVRHFMAHLATEEKEHVAEATELLRRLDAEQDALFAVDRGIEHFQGPKTDTPASEPQKRLLSRVTVGSLRNR